MSDLVQLPARAVSLKQGVLMTTSLLVAQSFEKQHFNVLRDIDELDCSPEFAKLNFELADYIDKNGDPRRMFDITRNGLMFLVMGYRGARAARMKEAYIARFDEMESALRNRGAAPMPAPAPIPTQLIPVTRYAELLEAEVALLKQRLAAPPASPAKAEVPAATRPEPVTDEQVATVLEMFNTGASKAAMARAIGRHPRTVGRILDRATRAADPQLALRLLDLGGES